MSFRINGSILVKKKYFKNHLKCQKILTLSMLVFLRNNFTRGSFFPILQKFYNILAVSPPLNNCLGFPGSSAGKESACNAGGSGLIPGSGRSTGEGTGYPLQFSWASLAQLVKNPPAVQET